MCHFQKLNCDIHMLKVKWMSLRYLSLCSSDCHCNRIPLKDVFCFRNWISEVVVKWVTWNRPVHCEKFKQEKKIRIFVWYFLSRICRISNTTYFFQSEKKKNDISAELSYWWKSSICFDVLKLCYWILFDVFDLFFNISVATKIIIICLSKSNVWFDYLWTNGVNQKTVNGFWIL